MSPISSICYESIEAFTLLIVENNYERWKAMAEGEKDRKKLPSPMYTQNGITGAGIPGWKAEGLQRYNDIMKMVIEYRKIPEASAVEQQLMQ